MIKHPKCDAPRCGSPAEVFDRMGARYCNGHSYMARQSQPQELPLDWDEWRTLWAAWLSANQRRMEPRSKAFPGKNFLADEILGTWTIEGRTVELSEVVFPNLCERDAETGVLLHKDMRRIGITYAKGDNRVHTVVGSLEELEQELFEKG